MDPALAFRFGNPLDPMGSGLEFEPRIGSESADLHDDLLVAVILTERLIQNLQLEALGLGEDHVGIGKLSREKRSLLSSGSSPDFEHDVLFVILILRNESDLQAFLKSGDFLFSGCDLLFGHLDELWIALLPDDGFRILIICANGLILLVEQYGLFKPLLLLHEILEPCGIVVDIRIRELSIKVLVFVDQIVEFEFHNRQFRYIRALTL